MRKIAYCSAALLALSVVPAMAKPAKPQPKPHKCEPHAVSYRVAGALVSQALTQTAGADTADRHDDRYGGTLTVSVTRANHHAATGEQTYTVDNARVRFYDADHNQVADQPKAGDRVNLRGKITQLAKKCDSTGFTPVITIGKIDFKAAKAPKPDPKPAKPHPTKPPKPPHPTNPHNS
jgi:hypothetical protein